ncbi:MAG: ParB/RepB/Spo0J family partition protein [Chloroflexi bacterium]|nr:MAG: ParB/RepB/Spo0J family partition protein [Chloroflexota bacterium]
MARPDFRGAAARRLSEERELSPAIISLLSPDQTGRSIGVRHVPVHQIEPNPEQPRLSIDQESLDELTASIREHGVLQPILVRPLGGNRFQLVAGERRWRASQAAGLGTIPALVEELDDDTALEISIIENLQREDLSPLDEASMYDRMIREHGYSVRRLAQKLGKDKGYLENRLRLADAPEEVRALVSVRKDTLSHAYELLKVDDPRKRRKLAEQVARGELSLVKLREKIEGRTRRTVIEVEDESHLAESNGLGGGNGFHDAEEDPVSAEAEAAWTGVRVQKALTDESLVAAKQQLATAVEDLVDVLRGPEVLESIGEVDRSNLAKYLTIAKLKLENAITLVRHAETP